MKLYGLIGFPLTHSFSKQYFEKKFGEAGITDCRFENFPLKSIDEVRQLVHDHPNLKGFAVTIPYKKKIIRFLDEGTEEVKQMVACNCVRIHNGRLMGYNTDVTGFRHSFTRLLKPHHRRALILGTGGASDAIAFVLEKLGMDYLFVSRDPGLRPRTISYKGLSEMLMTDYNVVINCSPVGTHPHEDEAPVIPYHYITPDHYLFDLVYNPAQTTFLKNGAMNGATTMNGLDMLAIQAEENWKIWNA